MGCENSTMIIPINDPTPTPSPSAPAAQTPHSRPVQGGKENAKPREPSLKGKEIFITSS